MAKLKNDKCAVYIVTHKESGKKYVGISNNPSKRWKVHIYYANKGSKGHFAYALNKYGSEAFDWRVITYARTFEIACELEKLAIKLGLGDYNMTTGGEGSPGVLIKQITRDKISAANTGRQRTPEWIENQSKARLGMKFTDEHKNNISIGHMGHKPSKETLDLLSSIRKGKKRSDTAKKNISDGRKGMKFSEEHRANIALAVKKVWEKRRQERHKKDQESKE